VDPEPHGADAGQRGAADGEAVEAERAAQEVRAVAGDCSQAARIARGVPRQAWPKAMFSPIVRPCQPAASKTALNGAPQGVWLNARQARDGESGRGEQGDEELSHASSPSAIQRASRDVATRSGTARRPIGGSRAAARCRRAERVACAPMSTYRVAEPARPAVERATRYAARRRLGPAADVDLEALTARGAAHLLRTIDAVCATASPEDLPFEDYALLDELGAGLADWLRGIGPARPAERPAA
jgi:hypothetical protein